MHNQTGYSYSLGSTLQTSRLKGICKGKMAIERTFQNHKHQHLSGQMGMGGEGRAIPLQRASNLLEELPGIPHSKTWAREGLRLREVACFPEETKDRGICVLFELIMMSVSVMGSLQQTWDVLTAL